MAQITIGASTTATTAAPSAATDGAALPFLCDRAVVFLYSTAGSGVMTCEARLWGYNPTVALWFPLGNDRADSGNDAGMLNSGFTIGEAGTDVIRHAEEVTGLRRFSRLYCQITAIAGTATAVTTVADLISAGAVTQA